jgi:hypothetical protein
MKCPCFPQSCAILIILFILVVAFVLVIAFVLVMLCLALEYPGHMSIVLVMSCPHMIMHGESYHHLTLLGHVRRPKVCPGKIK